MRIGVGLRGHGAYFSELKCQGRDGVAECSFFRACLVFVFRMVRVTTSLVGVPMVLETDRYVMLTRLEAG